MKRAANEFSEEVLWAQIREGVNRYEERHGGEKGVIRRKRKLDAKHSINGHDYLSKVVYIHPTEEVTKLNSSEFFLAIKNLLKAKDVIAKGDADKFRSKWFDAKFGKKTVYVNDLRLEFDIEGENAHPQGTVAVYGEAAIDLVNYVNQNNPDQAKKSKHKDRREDNVTDEPKKRSKHKTSDQPKKVAVSKKKTSDEPKKVAVSKKKTSDEPKKVAVSKKKTSDEPKKVAVTKKKASDEPKKVAVTKKKASDEPKKVAVTKKKASDEPKKVVRASEIKALSLKDNPKRPSQKQNNVVVPPVMNNIQPPEPSLVVEPQQDLAEEIAVRVLVGNDNSKNAAQVKSSENQQLKEEQELKQAPIANNAVIVLEDFDLAMFSEEGDPDIVEIRNLVRDNSSLASEMHRKSQEFESLEKQVVKTKELYESEKKALIAEVKTKLPTLRQQQAALTAQVESLGKRIEERALTQAIWEDKLSSIKKAKLEKSPEAQVTIPTQKPDSVLKGDSVTRRDSATALCQIVGQGEDSSKFSLDDLGVVSPTTQSMFSDWNRTAVLTRVGTASNLGSDEDKNSKPLSLSNLTPVVSKVRERSPEKDPAHESEGKRPKL